jgi:hypothetical protein
MLLLATTSAKLQVITGSAVTVDVHASFADFDGSTTTLDRQNSAITTATTTDVVGAPGASTQRNIKGLFIRNKHASSSVAITVVRFDGVNSFELYKTTLLAGESLSFVDGHGFRVIDASGAVK